MIVDIVMRFLHIFSAAIIVGGAFAWRVGYVPERGNAMAAAWRPIMLSAMGAILVSGLYQFMNVKNPPPAWHMVIGIKFLLVLHIFAVGFLITGQNNEKRQRQLTGIVISGAVVVALAATLRSLSTGL